MTLAPSTRCPLAHVAEIEACPRAELEPLCTWLKSHSLPSAPTKFPRGCAFSDGRLDLCKQSLGADNLRTLLDAADGNPWLRAILLGTNGLGDAGARALAAWVERRRAPQLDTLYLGCNRIGVDGLNALADAVESTPSIRALWLKRNPLSATATPRLRRLLESSQLRVLDLTNTELGAEACAQLFDALAKSDVEHLTLGAQGLGVEAGQALGACLARDPSLRSLSLAVNALGNAGVQALAHGLARNTRLERLNLSSNGFDEAGLQALLEAIAMHPRLQELELGAAPSTQALGAAPNRLTRGAHSLARFVAERRGLRALGLAGTELGSRGAKPIVEALEQRNEPLRELWLGTRIARSFRRRANARLVPLPPPPHLAAIRSIYR
ncbi:MAG: hypothetical protein QM756_19565 [Polyangiaceae bacterium]